MKRLIIISALFILFSSQIRAQYQAAVGLRGGKFTSGITAKYLFSPDNASGIELMFGRTKIAKSGWFGAAYYIHQFPLEIPILHLPLNFIGGAGAHVGYYPKRYYKIVEGYPVYYSDKSISVGIDALIGLEYVCPLNWLPVAVGVEAQPFVEFVNQGPEHLDFAITLKYVFNE